MAEALMPSSYDFEKVEILRNAPIPPFIPKDLFKCEPTDIFIRTPLSDAVINRQHPNQKQFDEERLALAKIRRERRLQKKKYV